MFITGVSGWRSASWISLWCNRLWGSIVYCSYFGFQLPHCTWQRQLWQGNLPSKIFIDVFV